MPIMRIKDNVPQPYVSESRDFQLFTRVLDFVQNSIKFDVDSITSILSTQDMPSNYIELLKTKLGFFTSNVYSDKSMRVVLSAFPHIVRDKGSVEGIIECIHTFLFALGIDGESVLNIYGKDGDYPYSVRIGIGKSNVNTQLLKDLLSYVIPAGYTVEVYTYTNPPVPQENFEHDSYEYRIKISPDEFSNIRASVINDTSDNLSTLKNDTLNTVFLGGIYSKENDSNEHRNEL